MSENKLKVLIVSTEVNPYAKSGGLGDVIGSLPKELVKLGIDARVVLPKYRCIKDELLENLEFLDTSTIKQGWRHDNVSFFKIQNEVTTYFVENEYFFGRDGFYGYGDDYQRFAFFSEALLNLINSIDFIPDVIHLNDWQSALTGVYLKDNYNKFLVYKDIKILFTIHNLQYQGVFGREILSSIALNDGYFNEEKIEFYGNVNYMKAGLIYADMISTVSETYAKEIQTPQFGYGLDGVLRYRSNDLIGITNGIDTVLNDPATDSQIFANYNKDDYGNKYINKRMLQEQLNLPQREDVPVLSIISRLVDQKGFDLIESVLEELMNKDIQLIILGTGDWRYENLFKHYAYRFPHKLSANIYFDANLAQKMYAGSDMFLMPSLFEPCGLGQIFSMRYGTIPIVRKTGGLSDTVTHYNYETQQGTGFLFEDYLPSGLIWAINEALRCYYDKYHFDKVIRNAMNMDFSWHVSAEKYVSLYNELKNRK